MESNAKKYAKELVDKFYNIDVISADIMSSCSIDAKQCALITVDELKNMDWYIPTKDEWNKYQDFLDEVKKRNRKTMSKSKEIAIENYEPQAKYLLFDDKFNYNLPSVGEVKYRNQ